MMMKKEAVGTSWHPHVYAKLPREPTRHFIMDILGLMKTSEDAKKTSQKDPFGWDDEMVATTKSNYVWSSDDIGSNDENVENRRQNDVKNSSEQPLNLSMCPGVEIQKPPTTNGYSGCGTTSTRNRDIRERLALKGYQIAKEASVRKNGDVTKKARIQPSGKSKKGK